MRYTQIIIVTRSLLFFIVLLHRVGELSQIEREKQEALLNPNNLNSERNKKTDNLKDGMMSS
jgi:hypothetical protein